jgi:CBS domain-containing protein
MTLSDLTDLLRAHRVFGLLDEAAFVDLAALFDVEDCPAGAPVSSEDAAGERLGWVLSGAISLAHEGGACIKLGAGELIGAGVTTPSNAATWLATADAGTRVAWLSYADVVRLSAAHPALGWFLHPLPAHPVQAATAVPAGDPYLNLLTTPIRTLIRRPAVTLPPTASVLQAAQTMRDARVSSLLLLKDEHLIGLVTDRDLRNRAVAAGLDTGLFRCWRSPPSRR